MFENKEYIKKLEEIRLRELLSRNELARLLNISPQTLHYLYTQDRTLTFPTKRKIRDFILSREA